MTTPKTPGEWAMRILEIIQKLGPVEREIFLPGVEGAFVLRTISVEEMERRSRELVTRHRAGELITTADLETLRRA